MPAGLQNKTHQVGLSLDLQSCFDASLLVIIRGSGAEAMKSVWATGILVLGRGTQHWSAGPDRQGSRRALGRSHSRCGHHDGHLHQILWCCRRLHRLQQVTARLCQSDLPLPHAIAPLAVRSCGEGFAAFPVCASFWLVVGLHVSRDANSGRC